MSHRLIGADSYTRIGFAHEIEALPCQDAAAAEITDSGIGIACVADGCSSSPGSEFGALFNTYLWRALVKSSFNYRSSGIGAAVAEAYLLEAREADLFARQDLSPQGSIFDATLVGARYVPGREACQVSIFGDGMVVARYRTGEGKVETQLSTMEWNNNAPPYLSYLLEEERLEALRASLANHPYHGTFRTIRPEKTPPGQAETIVLAVDHVLQLSPPTAGFNYEVPLVTPQGHSLISLSVCSDGLGDIRRLVTGGQSLLETDFSGLNDVFFSYGLPTGRFQARNCLWAFKRLLKEDYKPVDDFSVATLLFEDDLDV